MSKKIVVIGGVAGGATAVARLRRLDETSEIIMLEKGEYVSFANCGLPYYIGGVIKSRDALFVSTPEAISAKYNIDVRVLNEAVSIDKDKKTVRVRDLKENREYELSYDELIISTGSRPIKPNVEGFDGENVFTLWNIPDTDKIYNYVKEKSPKTATVIGGGFIGLEMAENLAHKGLAVTVVEKADQVMAPLDKDMANMVHRHMAEKGISLVLENGVSKITHSPSGSKVVLEDGREVNADIVILSIGIRANSELAKEAGADFVKTSTGFSSAGAKVEDVRLMRETVGPDMGVKASGGIHDKEFAKELVDAGANRLGTSATIEIVESAFYDMG